MTGSAAPTAAQTAAEIVARHAPPMPRAVQAAVQAAEEAQRAAYQTDAEPDGQDGGEGAAPPQPAPQPPPPAQAPPQDDMTWEQRARSALGRLETLNAENRQMSSRVDQLEGLIASLQAQGKQEVKPETQTPVAYVSDEERDQYGEEMLDVMGKRAREAVAPEVSALKAQVDALQNQLKGVGTVIQRQQTRTVYDTLGESVPEWRDINRSQEFKTWAAQVEPYSGQVRSKLIREAFDRHEGERVVRFFQGFLSEAAALDPGTAQPGSRTAPAPAAGNGKIPLERFATPGRTGPGLPVAPPAKPSYSRSAIANHYSEQRRGLWRGRETEWKAVEQDMFAAQNEGRITP